MASPKTVTAIGQAAPDPGVPDPQHRSDAPSAPGTPREPFPEFDALYASGAPTVWRALRRMGVPETNIEDALQDVFVVAFRRQHEFEGRSSLRTWLYGIAIRVARKCHEKTAKDRNLVSPEDGELVATGASPHALAVRTEQVRALQQILDSLDEAKREVFVLAEIEQLSAPEISEVLEIPLNTVYSRLRVARQIFDEAVKRRRARETSGPA